MSNTPCMIRREWLIPALRRPPPQPPSLLCFCQQKAVLGFKAIWLWAGLGKETCLANWICAVVWPWEGLECLCPDSCGKGENAFLEWIHSSLLMQAISATICELKIPVNALTRRSIRNSKCLWGKYLKSVLKCRVKWCLSELLHTVSFYFSPVVYPSVSREQHNHRNVAM